MLTIIVHVNVHVFVLIIPLNFSSPSPLTSQWIKGSLMSYYYTYNNKEDN